MRILDLTRPFSPAVPGFEQAPARTIERDGWNASTLTVYSHAGTHMDAPVHFGVTQQGIDEYAPARFISKAWMVNATGLPAKGLISVDMVATQIPLFRPGDSLLFRTGWEEHFGTPSFRDGLPRISEELAHWCVDRKVNMLGVESPSVANVNDLEEVTRIHRILLPTVIIIEGLVNLGQISAPSVQLLALPISIRGGDGAPVRVLAIEE